MSLLCQIRESVKMMQPPTLKPDVRFLGNLGLLLAATTMITGTVLIHLLVSTETEYATESLEIRSVIEAETQRENSHNELGDYGNSHKTLVNVADRN